MTKITEDELAAFADGELHGADEARVASAVAADPELAQTVEQHRALRASLGAHFAPILDQPVPDRLADPLRPRADVVDFAQARATKSASRTIPRWSWIAGPALAASLALALFIPRGGEVPEGYAGAQLAGVLDRQLVAGQASDAGTRILLSFQNEGGGYCRAFASTDQSGIACRDATGWELVREMGGVGAAGTEFRQAGNAQAELMAAAQDMAVNGALDSEGEREAMESGWQD